MVNKISIKPEINIHFWEFDIGGDKYKLYTQYSEHSRFNNARRENEYYSLFCVVSSKITSEKPEIVSIEYPLKITTDYHYRNEFEEFPLAHKASLYETLGQELEDRVKRSGLSGLSPTGLSSYGLVSTKQWANWAYKNSEQDFKDGRITKDELIKKQKDSEEFAKEYKGFVPSSIFRIPPIPLSIEEYIVTTKSKFEYRKTNMTQLINFIDLVQTAQNKDFLNDINKIASENPEIKNQINEIKTDLDRLIEYDLDELKQSLNKNYLNFSK